MSWKCDKCNAVNVSASDKCVLCFARFGLVNPKPKDIEYIYDWYEQALTAVRIYTLDAIYLRITGKDMNPKEQLFADFFAKEKALIKDMGDLELRAHREQLATIAFEAKARLTAIDDEEKERNKKRKGFKATVNPAEDINSEAINTINERTRKLSKVEKQIENLVKLGIDRAEAEKMCSAQTQLAVKKRKPGEIITVDGIRYNQDVKENKTPEYQNSIKGKCPVCLTEFPTELEGKTECTKCQTKVNVIKIIPFKNPFA